MAAPRPCPRPQAAWRRVGARGERAAWASERELEWKQELEEEAAPLNDEECRERRRKVRTGEIVNESTEAATSVVAYSVF